MEVCYISIFVACRWFKDGRELTDWQKYNILNDPRSGILCLTVVGATKEDIGQYECEVKNAHVQSPNGH